MSPSPRRVLLVEDDDELRSLLSELLELEGFNVASVCNGRQALDHLRAHDHPDLIVLDLMMPVMNGAEFRAEQLLDAELAPIPVVVVSASTDVKQQAEAMRALAYFLKPFAFDTFCERLRTIG